MDRGGADRRVKHDLARANDGGAGNAGRENVLCVRDDGPRKRTSPVADRWRLLRLTHRSHWHAPLWAARTDRVGPDPVPAQFFIRDLTATGFSSSYQVRARTDRWHEHFHFLDWSFHGCLLAYVPSPRGQGRYGIGETTGEAGRLDPFMTLLTRENASKQVVVLVDSATIDVRRVFGHPARIVVTDSLVGVLTGTTNHALGPMLELGPKGPPFTCLGHFNDETGELAYFYAGPHSAPEEPLLIPRSPDAPEGDGWLISIVGRRAENRTDLVILNALDIAAGPVATIRIPFRLHEGFHGTWVPAL